MSQKNNAVAGPLASLGLLLSLCNPFALFQAMGEATTTLRRQRSLILAMAHRDISTKYSGQLLGTFWAICHPLFQMGVMVFVFAVLFKQRLGGTFDMPRDYTVYILCGLAAWQSLIPILTTSTMSITSNASLLKQFNFDCRILPAKDILVGSVVWCVSIGIVILYTLAVYRSVPWTYTLLPIVALMHFMIAMGCAWLLSSVSVFFRDLKDVIVLVCTAMIYLLPIIYLPTWMPSVFRPIIYLNPFSYLIWVYQDTFYFGRFEHPWAWAITAIFAMLVFITGYRVFRRLQPMFGSAL